VIDYTFETRDGRTIKSRIDRPATELALVPTGTFAVNYWPAMPWANTPRELVSPSGLMLALAGLLLLAAGYFALMCRRALRRAQT
jgi:hypothetical protein